MSNLNAIGVIGALFIAACFFLHHVLITFNRKNIEIITGVAQGVPTPQDMRWRTLMLVPLTIDATPLPFGCARLQTTDISGWHGSTKDPRWQTVVDSIEATLGDGGHRQHNRSPAGAGGADSRPGRPRRLLNWDPRR
jgi:hypothetical protein